MKRISEIFSLTAITYGVFLLTFCLSATASADEKNLKEVHAWSGEEITLLRSLSLSSLPARPKDPSNAYADDPRAIELGKRLFFDKKFSANGKVSCATCHIPEHSFTDKTALAKGMGTTTRRTMPLIGAAYNAWFFWDGSKDSLWSQAIGPIESSVEHGFTRSMCAHLIADKYKREYEEIFGKLPRLDHKSCPPKASPGTGNPAALKAWNAMKPEDRDSVSRIYANIGKAIAAFVSQILPHAAPFDKYVDAVVKNDLEAADKLMSSNAVDGLRLFIGKAKCTSCHMGPLFTNSSFHDIGLRNPRDKGRAEGIGKVLADEFNCLGKYSDAKPEECLELRFIDTNKAKYAGAFKTPTLRNVAERPPYMHAGQLKTLSEVLSFYRRSSSLELEHGELTNAELLKIEAFLRTLSGPLSFPQLVAAECFFPEPFFVAGSPIKRLCILVCDVVIAMGKYNNAKPRHPAKCGKANRIWVMDRGMVSEENIELMRERCARYLVGTSKSMLKKFEQELLEKDWEEVHPGVEVKKCASTEGKDETFVLCRSEGRKDKETAILNRFVARLQAGLNKLKEQAELGRLRDRQKAKRRIGRLLERNSRAASLFDVSVTEIGAGKDRRLAVDIKKNEERYQWALQSGGNYILRTNWKKVDPKTIKSGLYSFKRTEGSAPENENIFAA